ncbi:hypothetical protein MKEN_00954300 [Mycena kentingensis (nom. inval.)]|nr:hypothetical protein MKEN_00954300 [Mycena kentingensis (nom. inval.)]
MSSKAASKSRPTSSKAPTKDLLYFFEDGDCTFLAGGVIFKLHKLLLCRDPKSMFRNLFNDAKGDASEMIPLSDSAEDIRALCWLLYMLPGDVYNLAKSPGKVDVLRHLRILDMTHKYILPHYESLAWTMLNATPNALSDFLVKCSEDQLEYALALGCRHTSPDATLRELLGLVEQQWITRIINASPETSLRRALDIGERYGRRRIQTRVYLQLRKWLCWEKYFPPPTTARKDLAISLTRSYSVWRRGACGCCMLFGLAVMSPFRAGVITNTAGTHGANCAGTTSKKRIQSHSSNRLPK